MDYISGLAATQVNRIAIRRCRGLRIPVENDVLSGAWRGRHEGHEGASGCAIKRWMCDTQCGSWDKSKCELFARLNAHFNEAADRLESIVNGTAPPDAHVVTDLTVEQLKLYNPAPRLDATNAEIRMNTIDAIRFVSDEDLAATTGGRANDGTNYQKWQGDPSPDKLPWPAPSVPSIPIPPPHLIFW
jgi:hypothetical protein